MGHGAVDGAKVGSADGFLVGDAVGAEVGFDVVGAKEKLGVAVGFALAVGLADREGAAVGEKVGLAVARAAAAVKFLLLFKLKLSTANTAKQQIN